MKKQRTTNPSFSSRPPIVTVMGHVDHGKTSLLDIIRKTNVVNREHGRITQHIGAYQVKIDGKKITFIDTPGHEAFSKMRARGASVTDIVILVIAADDGVMPQTIESLKHIKEASVPFLVAINKIDLPSANVEKVKKQLAENEVYVEGYGGDIVAVPVSAKTGEGVDQLLEMILLLAEMEELKADPGGVLKLAVIESRLDKAKGPVATVIIQNGTLKVGEVLELGGVKSKVRAMINDKGERIKEAAPSTPVEVIGLSEVPQIGEQIGRDLSRSEISSGGERKLKIILKADVAGSLEAILHNLSSDDCQILSAGVGAISESDVLLAKGSEAIVIGFNVKILPHAEKLAQIEKVPLKIYKIIYELLEEVKEAIETVKSQEKEEILGRAKIVAEFPYEKTKVAGCQVLEGRIMRQDILKIIRGQEEIGKTKIKSIRHLQEDISKAEVGSECGIVFATPLDFIIGDVIIVSAKTNYGSRIS